jgi:NTE family protein
MSIDLSLGTDKDIALVLGAGGARGLAHIGAIEVLQEHGYNIVAVAGTSQGALVGGIFATGKLDEYARWAQTLERSDVIRLLDIAFGHPGFIKGERVIGVLRELVGDYLIEDLPIPYTAVATDLYGQREVWLDDGPLFDAIRASIAIPMVFTPHMLHGRELVDGGLISPVPLATMRRVPGKPVIAIDVNGPPQRKRPHPVVDQQALAAAYGIEAEDPDADEEEASLSSRMSALWEEFKQKRAAKPEPDGPGLMELMSRSMDTMQARISRLQIALDPPDLLIQIPRDCCFFYEYWRAKELIEIGRLAAEKALARWE